MRLAAYRWSTFGGKGARAKGTGVSRLHAPLVLLSSSHRGWTPTFLSGDLFRRFAYGGSACRERWGCEAGIRGRRAKAPAAV